jgi:hypothetical protein
MEAQKDRIPLPLDHPFSQFSILDPRASKKNKGEILRGMKH